MTANCLHFALDHKNQATIYCSADAGHGGEHYREGPRGENLCYWDNDGNIRWVNR